MNDAERETLERRIDELCAEVERGKAEFKKMDAWHSQELKAAMDENAKLRELVKDMWPHVRHRSRMCVKCDLPCDTSDECLLYEPMRQRMRELGLVVE